MVCVSRFGSLIQRHVAWRMHSAAPAHGKHLRPTLPEPLDFPSSSWRTIALRQIALGFGRPHWS